MKPFLILFLLALTIARGWTQQALVNPTSVTLTQPGTVTVIITGQLVGAWEYGNTGRTTPPIHVTVGTVQATYSSAIGTSMAELGVVTGIMASSVSTGTLGTGTYQVVSDSTVPIQITVILWNESADGDSGTIALSDVTLSYESASEQDKAAFQALIVSLVQQQLSALQGQITTQQSQIAALQDSGSGNTSAISSLQEQLGSMQTRFDALLGEFDTVSTRMSRLETQLAGINATNGTNGSNEPNDKNNDNTVTYIGVGLGAAGVVGAVMNAVFDSNSTVSPEDP